MKKEYDKIDILIVAVICIVVTVVIYTGITYINKSKTSVHAEKSSSNNYDETEPRLIHDSKYDVYVFTDKETGIEYLIVDSDRSGSISITPRIKYSNKYNGY